MVKLCLNVTCCQFKFRANIQNPLFQEPQSETESLGSAWEKVTAEKKGALKIAQRKATGEHLEQQLHFELESAAKDVRQPSKTTSHTMKMPPLATPRWMDAAMDDVMTHDAPVVGNQVSRLVAIVTRLDQLGPLSISYRCFIEALIVCFVKTTVIAVSAFLCRSGCQD